MYMVDKTFMMTSLGLIVINCWDVDQWEYPNKKDFLTVSTLENATSRICFGSLQENIEYTSIYLPCNKIWCKMELSSLPIRSKNVLDREKCLFRFLQIIFVREISLASISIKISIIIAYEKCV